MKNFFINKIKEFNNFDKSRQVTIGAILFLLIAFSFFHIKLVSDTFFIDEGGNIKSTLEGYGDMPLHMTQISKFAFGSSFNLDEPIYFGRDLQYHFLFNLIRGIFLKITNNWSMAVLWPAYLLVVINIFLTYAIYRRLTKNSWLASGSLLLFYLGAGTAGWKVLFGASTKIITNLNAIYPNQNIVFGPVLSMSFIHQQTFILGATLFLLMIWIINKLKTSNNWKLIIAGVVILALLPSAHMHSFIAIMIFAFFSLFFAYFNKENKYFKNILTVFIPGIFLALPSVYFLTVSDSSSVGGSLKFRLGWMVEKGIGSVNFAIDNARSLLSFDYLSFLFANFGFILPIFIVICIYLLIKNRINRKNNGEMFQKKFKDLNVYLLSAVSIFILVQTIQFQTWDYDNNKLLVYFMYFVSPVILLSIYEMFAKKSVKIITICLILSVCIFSGLTDIVFRMNVKKDSLHQIFDHNAVAMAEYVKTNIDEQDLILTGMAHTNPIASLAGRQILVGYTGWLWSRGVNYQGREKAIKDFYLSPNAGSQLLKDYNIKYILVDTSIAGNFSENVKKFDTVFDREFESGNNVLYRVGR